MADGYDALSANESAERWSVFEGFHPLLNYLYFAYVVIVTVFFLHPVLLAISFASASAWSVRLGGAKALRFGLIFVLPLMLVATALNPVFNHEGVTILGYLMDNPITLESILYGVCAALMIGGVILWFRCYTSVMSSDKFIYLFGRVAPAASLIISMTLRFIPRYVEQAGRIASARRGLGFDVSSGGFAQRVKNGGEVLSIMITWALENAVDTADSMRSRGYGLPGRTAYSIYRFDARDGALLLVLCALTTIVCVSIFSGTVNMGFFPLFSMNATSAPALVAYVCHAVVCLSPFALDVGEDFVWRSLQSRI
ncbi:MAG: energy-coupling factor transporter transmembrane protein EcfT [Clostridiales Family XIII bacterium]|jgi:energy-coupling factor transport system permease protein|nr:energy-coupling factor transporter transmembrane protein EcfT [Clostridiales Family XIII bacterium]